jgi:tetratricopeptide (TPR) repeat protein
MMNKTTKSLFIGLLSFVLCWIVVKADDLKPEIRALLDKGDTTSARKALEAEIAVDGAYHMNYFQLGEISFAELDWVKAKEHYQQALQRKPKHWESLAKLGRCYIHLGKLDSAEAVMLEGRKKAKQDAHIFDNGYGLVLMAQKKYSDADRAFRQALVDHDNVAEYHVNLGDANLAQGVAEIAAGEYEKALALAPGSTDVLYHWAEACMENKDYKCALEKLKIVLQTDSTHDNAWMRAGSIYFKAAQSSRGREERTALFKDVIGAYKRYFELSKAECDSSTVRPFFELGMAYQNISGFEDAVGYFEKVLAIPYEPRDIFFHYAKALWGLKQYDKSGQMMTKHEEWTQKSGNAEMSTVSKAELYQVWGDSYFYRDPKDYLMAITYYKKSLETDSLQKRLLYNVAIGYHTSKSYVQALEYYQKRISMGIDSANAGAYKNAGYCALNIANGGTGGGQQVEDELDLNGSSEVAVVTPDVTADASVDYYKVAVDMLAKYLDYAPNDPKVLSLLGNTYVFQMSDCANGTRVLEQLLTVEPKNCVAQKSLGFAYFGGKVCTPNYGRAIKYLTDAHQCDSGSKDVDLVLWVAQCYHLLAAEKMKSKENASAEFKNAYDWYTKVLAIQPNNPDAKKGVADTKFEF